MVAPLIVIPDAMSSGLPRATERAAAQIVLHPALL
jgi:hypothetical protein